GQLHRHPAGARCPALRPGAPHRAGPPRPSRPRGGDRAPHPCFGDRRRSAFDLGLCAQQGGWRAGGTRRLSARDDPAPVYRVRPTRLRLEIRIGIASLQARLMAILPSPPLTADQVELLKRDNVVSTGALTLAMLGITPTAVEAILPTYLDRFRKGGWYERRRP